MRNPTATEQAKIDAINALADDFGDDVVAVFVSDFTGAYYLEVKDNERTQADPRVGWIDRPVVFASPIDFVKHARANGRAVIR